MCIRDRNGTVYDGTGISEYNIGNKIVSLPAAYRVRLFWDGQVVEELTIEGGKPDGTK